MTKEELQTEVETEEVLTAEDGAEGVVLREDDAFEAMLKNAMSTAPSVPEGFRCGYVAVVGRPNVGEVDAHQPVDRRKGVDHVEEAQTTRDRVLGVVTEEDAQYVFVDTPGFQTKVGSQLIRRMNRQVRSTLNEVDAIVLVIESGGWRPADLEVVNLLPKDAKNVILALNKTDLLKGRDKLLPLDGRIDAEVPLRRDRAGVGRKGPSVRRAFERNQGVPPRERAVFRPRHLHRPLAPVPRGRDDPREGLPPSGRRASVRLRRHDRPLEGRGRSRRDHRDPHRRARKPQADRDRRGRREASKSRASRAPTSPRCWGSAHLEVWVRVRRGGWSDDARALKSLVMTDREGAFGPLDAVEVWRRRPRSRRSLSPHRSRRSPTGGGG